MTLRSQFSWTLRAIKRGQQLVLGDTRPLHQALQSSPAVSTARSRRIPAHTLVKVCFVKQAVVCPSNMPGGVC